MPRGIYQRTEYHRNKLKVPRVGSGIYKHKPLSEEHKNKISLSLIGNKRTLGHKLTKEHKDKISKSNKGKHFYWLGKKFSKIHKLKLSKINQMENNANWQGGKSFELYGIEFNNELKEQIKKRDNHQCQECKVFEIKLKRKLCIHHIDYNKKNNNPNNLISLCLSCHMKTNFKREDWIKYFKTNAKNKYYYTS